MPKLRRSQCRTISLYCNELSFDVAAAAGMC